MDDVTLTKVFVFNQKVNSFRLDPYLETADCDLDNNSWPPVVQPTRFQLFNQQRLNVKPKSLVLVLINLKIKRHFAKVLNSLKKLKQ